MSKQYIATYWLISSLTGRIIGTGYYYDNDNIDESREGFKWRNATCKKKFKQDKKERER